MSLSNFKSTKLNKNDLCFFLASFISDHLTTSKSLWIYCTDAFSNYYSNMAESLRSMSQQSCWTYSTLHITTED